MKKYLIIVEKTPTGYSAYSPDVPGCGSTGQTKEEVEHNIQEAIQFHIEGLREAVRRQPFQPFTIRLADGRSCGSRIRNSSRSVTVV